MSNVTDMPPPKGYRPDPIGTLETIRREYAAHRMALKAIREHLLWGELSLEEQEAMDLWLKSMSLRM